MDGPGSYECPGCTPVFSRPTGSQNAWEDVCQVWLTPAYVASVFKPLRTNFKLCCAGSAVYSDELKDALRSAVDAAMGPKEDITLAGPVRNANGNWSGGLLMERGDDRCKPVKAGTRCYTIANSYQTPKEMWSPMAQSKVNGAIDEGNLLRRNLILVRLLFFLLILLGFPRLIFLN